MDNSENTPRTSQKPRKIIIAGGGTGGHIFPALAIGKALREINPDINILFAGANRGMESRIIPAQGEKLVSLPIGRFNHNVSRVEKMLTLLSLPLVLFKTLWILLKIRPDVVFGVGGYASAPLVYVASKLRISTLIWEPNAYPGLANRWLAPHVDQTLVVFERALAKMKAKKAVRAGMPVREKIEKLPAYKVSSEGPLKILVFGGSQGAQAINKTLTAAVKQGGAWLNKVQILHQTGPRDFDWVQEDYGGHHSNIETMTFIEDMDKKFAWADLVICRSGASTVAELMACGRPSILIPYPFASDDHQTQNALTLAEAGAAKLIAQRDFNAQQLIDTLNELTEDRSQLQQMGDRARSLHKPMAANKIARQILERASYE